MKLTRHSWTLFLGLTLAPGVVQATTQVFVTTNSEDVGKFPDCPPGDLATITLVRDSRKDVKKTYCTPYGLSKKWVQLVSDALGTEYIFTTTPEYHGSPGARILTIYKIKNKFVPMRRVEIEAPIDITDDGTVFFQYKYSIIKPVSGGIYVRFERKIVGKAGPNTRLPKK